MVTAFYGKRFTPEQIAPLVYTPGRQGSLQIEILAAARSLGFAPYKLTNNLPDLLRELDAGHPVLVLQNLALPIYPMWHYAVVIGYDSDEQKLILHTGDQANYRVSIATFDRTWARAKRWGLVILPPGQLPKTSMANQVLETAIGLEQTRHPRAALLTYQAGVKRWPNNFALRMGIANTHMQLNEPLAAGLAYREALKLDNRSAAVLNNFAYSAQQLGCEITALDAARCALRYAGREKKSVEETILELENKSTRPINHGTCPVIHCR